MPDDTAQVPATESTAPGTPAPSPAAAASQPPLSSPQTTDYTFDPADLADPTWGPKLKAVHEWGRKGHGKIGEYESKVRSYESQVSYARKLLSDPDEAKRVYDHLKANKQPIPALLAKALERAEQAGAEEEPDKLTLLEKQVEDLKAALASDNAERDAILRLGKGNLDEGRKLYSERHPKLMEIMDRMSKSDPQSLLAFAMHVHDLENGAASRAATQPPDTNAGTATTDLGRGSASTPQAPAQHSADSVAQSLGYANARAWELANVVSE
jgi:hypothetical protein